MTRSFLDEILSRTARCALCRQERDKADLQPLEGHLLCSGCLRLVREEGIALPGDIEEKP